MNGLIRFQHCVGAALLLLAAGLSAFAADEPSGNRKTPVIFSTPRSDTVSSNLNRIGTRSSPLTELESGLKKPFELFERPRSSTDFRGPIKYTPQAPPAPELKNKKLKALLDKQAEDEYLLRQDDKTGPAGEDAFLLNEDPFSPSAKRPKSMLDRYYDRVEQSRSGATNQSAGNLGRFGEKAESKERDEPAARLAGGLFGDELPTATRPLGHLSNSLSTASSWLTPGRENVRSFGDIFGLGAPPKVELSDKKKTQDTRLDDFKRLLEGPGYGTRSELNPASPSLAVTPASVPKASGITPGSIWPASPQPAGSDGFATSARLAGTPAVPARVTENFVGSPSLTPTPALQPPATKPPPLPTFNVPRRRF